MSQILFPYYLVVMNTNKYHVFKAKINADELIWKSVLRSRLPDQNFAWGTD